MRILLWSGHYIRQEHTIYTYKEKNEIIGLSVLYFWCPITSFSLVLYFHFYFSLEDVEKCLQSGGWIERFSRPGVTVNTPIFQPEQSFHQICTQEVCIFNIK